MSNNYLSLGSEIRKVREETGQSIVDVAKMLTIDRSNLNKIELGKAKPSEDLLRRILAHFSVSDAETRRILRLAGYEAAKIVSDMKGNEVQIMQPSVNDHQKTGPNVNITIDPNTRPVLYSESVFIQSSDYGLTMDFAQRVGPSDQQFVVARIGMSFDHAKKMLEVLSDHLLKNER